MSKDFLQNQGPAHVAIIMDGNGRWAELRKRPRLLGHYAGARRVREIVESCPSVGVKYLTIFAFSTENWKRTQSEVSGLMSLFRRYIQREAQNLKKEMVRVPGTRETQISGISDLYFSHCRLQFHVMFFKIIVVCLKSGSRLPL